MLQGLAMGGPAAMHVAPADYLWQPAYEAGGGALFVISGSPAAMDPVHPASILCPGGQIVALGDAELSAVHGAAHQPTVAHAVPNPAAPAHTNTSTRPGARLRMRWSPQLHEAFVAAVAEVRAAHAGKRRVPAATAFFFLLLPRAARQLMAPRAALPSVRSWAAPWWPHLRP